jgi:ectoine hydroxylase-related dioxygenase (phytanoyl-CoA dioxygenase family)
MTALADAYRSVGCTDVCRVVDEEALEPIQQLIWELTGHLVPDEARERPLGERLRVPFAKTPTAEDFARLMNTVNASVELRRLTALPEVVSCFRAALGTDEIEPFPISRFRAQVPGIARSRFAWHQDEATWYAVPVKDLAYRLPATLWLSLNGADPGNSIEVIPRSHDYGLAHHRFQEGQGYFHAAVPRAVAALDRCQATTRAGEGLVLHPLLFHRSIPSSSGPPRYSVDVRYCPKERPRAAHAVDWRLRMKRWLTW